MLEKKIESINKLNINMQKAIKKDLAYLKNTKWESIANDSFNSIRVLSDEVRSPFDNIMEEDLSHYCKIDNNIYLLNGLEEGELLHEIGHAIEYNKKIKENEKYISIVMNLIKGKGIYDVIYDQNNFEPGIIRLVDDRFISLYQGALTSYTPGPIKFESVREYFSEGFKFYIIEPKKLEKLDPALYNFIKEMV